MSSQKGRNNICITRISIVTTRQKVWTLRPSPRARNDKTTPNYPKIGRCHAKRRYLSLLEAILVMKIHEDWMLCTCFSQFTNKKRDFKWVGCFCIFWLRFLQGTVQPLVMHRTDLYKTAKGVWDSRSDDMRGNSSKDEAGLANRWTNSRSSDALLRVQHDISPAIVSNFHKNWIAPSRGHRTWRGHGEDQRMILEKFGRFALLHSWMTAWDSS